MNSQTNGGGEAHTCAIILHIKHPMSNVRTVARPMDQKPKKKVPYIVMSLLPCFLLVAEESLIAAGLFGRRLQKET